MDEDDGREEADSVDEAERTRREEMKSSREEKMKLK